MPSLCSVVLSTETRQASATSQVSHVNGCWLVVNRSGWTNYMGCNPDQKGRSGCKAYRPISGIVQLSGMGKYSSLAKGISSDTQRHMNRGKWARVLKCWPDQDGSSLDSHTFRLGVAFMALNCPSRNVLVCPYGLLAGGSLLGVTRRTHRYAWPLSVSGFGPWVGSQRSTVPLKLWSSTWAGILRCFP